MRARSLGWLGFDHEAQGVADFFVFGGFEHGADGFVSLAGVNDGLRPLLGLIEFILQQIEPGEAVPGGGSFRTGFEQVRLGGGIILL